MDVRIGSIADESPKIPSRRGVSPSKRRTRVPAEYHHWQCCIHSGSRSPMAKPAHGHSWLSMGSSTAGSEILCTGLNRRVSTGLADSETGGRPAGARGADWFEYLE